jgi:peroxiredoxin
MKISKNIVFLVALRLGVGCAHAADPPAVRAVFQPARQRKPAPAFVPTDAAGKKVKLSDYHGKVLLLNFWATECGGCREEIPYFIEFAQKFSHKDVAVVGVSIDILYENLKDSNEGWSKVKPFVQAHKVNYPILMGDDSATKLYDIKALPATYLIDKKGRIAATYLGVVDKNDVEKNIKTLLINR